MEIMRNIQARVWDKKNQNMEYLDIGFNIVVPRRGRSYILYKSKKTGLEVRKEDYMLAVIPGEDNNTFAVFEKDIVFVKTKEGKALGEVVYLSGKHCYAVRLKSGFAPISSIESVSGNIFTAKWRISFAETEGNKVSVELILSDGQNKVLDVIKTTINLESAENKSQAYIKVLAKTLKEVPSLGENLYIESNIAELKQILIALKEKLPSIAKAGFVKERNTPIANKKFWEEIWEIVKNKNIQIG